MAVAFLFGGLAVPSDDRLRQSVRWVFFTGFAAVVLLLIGPIGCVWIRRGGQIRGRRHHPLGRCSLLPEPFSRSGTGATFEPVREMVCERSSQERPTR